MNENERIEEQIKILVVDDAKVILSFYQKGLSRAGYDVDVVENAIKALEMIAVKDYDIVISDINMELMDGLELLDVIKRDHPHLEVIMMTGYATVENAIEALKKGAYDFLLKPVKLDQVRLVVGNCVDKIRMSQEVRHLREVNARLREIKEMKDRFIAITSHELRTPVTHIKSYLDFLDEPGFSEEDRKMFLSILKKSAADLERIVMHMFEITKIEGRALSSNKELTRLDSIVQDCLQQMTVDLMDRTLQIYHQKLPDLPEIMIDAFQIKKVVLEILNNAIRFTKDGGSITISYEVLGKILAFVIEDTGIGIPEKQLGMIFEKFYEVQDSSYHTSSRTNFMGGGIGIGLVLAKGIVETHGGRLKIDSKEGVGTKVTIYFKMTNGEEPTQEESMVSNA